MEPTLKTRIEVATGPMRFFEDIPAAQPIIEEAIKKFGYAAEHNFYWYQCYLEPGWRNVFVETKHGYLFAACHEEKGAYYVSFDPLAPVEHRAAILVEYIDWVFQNTDAEKVWLQLETPRRKELLKLLPDRYRSNHVYFKLTWPIYDLRTFDATLPGGHYKSLRKEMHKFEREHQISVEDARTYGDLKSLHTIIDDWEHKRPNPETAQAAAYHRLIDAKFAGSDEARVLMVDGKVRGFNAGWMVPNSDRFYGAVGIHDYSLDGLGTMLYLEDLFWLKDHGYGEVDMAGSEKPLLAFKNKFCTPSSFYETSHFSIVRARP
jgi:hypothetical protein